MRILSILSVAFWLAHSLHGQTWPTVPPVDFSQIQLSQFADHELEVPYFLRHFAQVANAVVETGEHRGFPDIKVNREPADNLPHNARIMEMQAALAYFYTANRPWNPYRGSETVRLRLEAMLDRWHRIQAPPGHPHAGLFTEYSSTNWSLSPTGFGARHAAEAIDLIRDSSLPFDATILENARISLRRALMAVFTRSDMRNAARQYSNQFSGSYHAALIYLENWPDPELDSALLAALQAASTQDKSPAGFWYEQGGPDIGYSNVHDANMRIALPRLRNRPDLMAIATEDDTAWNRWLAAMAVPQPDLASRTFLVHAGIGTRTNYSVKFPGSRPWSEWVTPSRIFSLTDAEFAAATSARRAQVQSQFGTWGPLAVPSSSSYIPSFVHDAVRPLNTWHPTASQREAALSFLDCLAPGSVNRVLRDPRPTVFTTAKRPQYYAALTTGTIRVPRQAYGLGLLWNPSFGAALQSLPGDPSSNPWFYGTRRSGTTAPYETENLPATLQTGGTTHSPPNGETILPAGDLLLSYPLASSGTTYGQKSITLGSSRILVSIQHGGSFTELLPLAHAADATLEINGSRLRLRRPNGAQLLLDVHSPGATLQSASPSSLTAGMVRRAVTLHASDRLTYSLTLGNAAHDFLLGHWPFDLDLQDSSGSHHHLNPAGSATIDTSASRFGPASLLLDTSSAHALSPAPITLGEQFTLSAWIRLPSGPTSIRTLAANSPSGFNANGFRLFVNRFNTNNAELVLETGNGSQASLIASPQGTIAMDVWQHITATLDRANGLATLHLNGSPVASGPIRHDFALDSPLALGAMIGGLHGLRGQLDEVRIFSRLLEPAEINALLAQGSGRQARWTATSPDSPLDWSSAAHWDGSIRPEPGPDCDLDFLSSIETTSPDTITARQDLSLPFSARSLRLGGSGPATLRILGAPLELVANGTNTPALFLNAGHGFTHLVESPLQIPSNLFISGNGPATFLLSAPIHGPGGIVKSGTATLTLAGPNSFTGPISLQSGTLRARHDSALGSPTAGTTIHGGNALASLELDGDITSAEPIQLLMQNTPGHAHLHNLSGHNTLTGPISLNSGGARWDIRSSAGSLHLAGPVTNLANPSSPDTWRKLHLAGPAGGTLSGTLAEAPKSKLNLAILSGIWHLTGNSKTHTGTTEVLGGTLRIDTSLQSRVILGPDATLHGQGGSTSAPLEIQTNATLLLTPNSWDHPPLPFTASQILLSHATLRLDSSQLSSFSETPRSFPILHSTSTFPPPDPSQLTVETPGFPGSGRWSVSSTPSTLTLEYQPDLYLAWSASIDWQENDPAPLADPDHDGIPNLLEYALGGNPLRPDPAVNPQPSLTSDGQLAITFNRLADPALTYQVEASANLAPGSWTPVWTSTGAANLHGPVTVSDSPPSPPPSRRFLRLRVSRTALP